jgi:hypothetical protein
MLFYIKRRPLVKYEGISLFEKRETEKLKTRHFSLLEKRNRKLTTFVA